MIVVVCPGCHRRLQLADNQGGHEGRCSHCGRVVRFGCDPGQDTNETATDRNPETGSHPAVQPSPSAPPAYDFLGPPAGPDEIGRLGEYRVLQLLGQGAMGVVFRAEDVALGRMIALKVMVPAVAALPENRERFLREARATAAINHPNVIPIYKVGEDRGVPYLAMPLLKGESLESCLNREGRFAVGDAVRIGREIAAGLAAAHERNLIHRDIKPANLWLESVQRRNASYRVKILDFGLARFGDASLTTPGAVLGTPAYMAPEQARGLTVDYRCDLFSLGCVMYRMLTGERPFQGNEVFAVLMALTTSEPIPPHQVDAAVPLELSQLVMRLLVKDPSGRPQSAAAVADELEGFGLTAGSASSSDKLAVRSAGSSSRLPLKGPGSRVTRSGGANADRDAGAGVSDGTGRRSFQAGVWATVILLVCLAAFWARGLFATSVRGTVTLNVTPADAVVTVDSRGEALDSAGSARLTLPPGKHHFEVKRNEYQPAVEDVDVTAGDNPAVTIRLEKLDSGQSSGHAATSPDKSAATENKPNTAPVDETAQVEPKRKKEPARTEAAPRPPDTAPPRQQRDDATNASGREGKRVPAPAAVAVTPVRSRGDRATPNAPEAPRPLPSADRRAALWVLDCGGELRAKVADEQSARRVRSRLELPKGEFHVVIADLESRPAPHDSGLESLRGLEQLASLDLSGTSVTDRGMAVAASLPALKILRLRGTGLTDESVPRLCLLTGLAELDLRDTSITDAGVRAVRSAVPKCHITGP